MLRNHLRANLPFYTLLLASLVAGIIIGAWKSPLRIDGAWGAALTGRLTSPLPPVSLYDAALNQLPWLAVPGFLGITAVGVALVVPVIFFKGYCLGFTVCTLSRVSKGGGLGFAMCAVLPHNLIYVPCLLAAAVCAIKFSAELIGGRWHGGALLRNLFLYLMAMMVIALFMVLGALVECRVTPWLLNWW